MEQGLTGACCDVTRHPTDLSCTDDDHVGSGRHYLACHLRGEAATIFDYPRLHANSRLP
jgi:hypothetical protein